MFAFLKSASFFGVLAVLLWAGSFVAYLTTSSITISTMAFAWVAAAFSAAYAVYLIWTNKDGDLATAVEEAFEAMKVQAAETETPAEDKVSVFPTAKPDVFEKTDSGKLVEVSTAPVVDSASVVAALSLVGTPKPSTPKMKAKKAPAKTKAYLKAKAAAAKKTASKAAKKTKTKAKVKKAR